MSNFLPLNFGGVQPAERIEYPAGEYLLTIESAVVEPAQFQAGPGHRLVIRTRIEMGPGPSTQLNGRPFTHRLPVTENSKAMTLRFLLNCGVTQEQIGAAGGNIDVDWLIGKRFVARLSTNEKGYVNADRERPADAWTYAGGQQTAAPASPGLLQPLAPAPAPAPAAAPAAPQYAPAPAPAAPQYAPAPAPQYAPAPAPQYAPAPAPAPAPAAAPQQGLYAPPPPPVPVPGQK